MVLALALLWVGCGADTDGAQITWPDGGTYIATITDGSVQHPATARETKLWIQQRRVDGGIPPDETDGCACELTDETSSARQDCFEGYCTGCYDLDECELTCWWEYEDYMAQ